MDRREWDRLDGPDGATGGTRNVRAEREEGASSPGGTRGYSMAEPRGAMQAALEVAKGAPHGTQCGTRGYSRKLIPDGTSAGTAVVGASEGEGVGASVGEGVVGAGVGEGVPAKMHAQRWTARHEADVSTRRAPLRWS